MRDAWTEAAAIAKELGVDYIGTDMLLLGLARTEGIAADVLASAVRPKPPSRRSSPRRIGLASSRQQRKPIWLKRA